MRFLVAAIAFSLGTVLAWLGHCCVDVGYRWAGDFMMHDLVKAIRAFQAVPSQGRHARRRAQDDQSMARWEHHLQRVAPPILIGIGGALVVLWALLGLGGLAVWLVSHGYGFSLLLGTIVCGALIGNSKLVMRYRKRDQHRYGRERLN
jgi:Flp pilus assembly protein TadB